MHKYLRSIGFSQHTSKKDIDGLLEEIYVLRESVDVIHLEHGSFTCISKSFGHGIGLTVCGEYDEHDVFQRILFPLCAGRQAHYLRRMQHTAACGEMFAFPASVKISWGFPDLLPAESRRYMRRGIPGDALLSNTDIVMSPCPPTAKSCCRSKRRRMKRPAARCCKTATI